MCSKIIAFAIALSCCFSSKVQVQGCKLVCPVCPPYDGYEKYYCCMEDWDEFPRIEDCGPVSPSTSSPSPSPIVPTVVPPATITCPPSKCPEVGSPSAEECEAHKRIHAFPTTCTSDADCRPLPFNVCCDDGCFTTKICKTFLDEFTLP